LLDCGAFQDLGYSIVPGVYSSVALDGLIIDLADTTAHLPDRRGGARLSMSQTPALVAAATRSSLMDLANALLGMSCFAVRALYFDKTPDTNWRVTWHQDLTIAVNQQKYAPGFGPWSEKNGVVHVQPPPSVLESMIAIRLHLDDCGATNGPLRVIPGSHTAGRLSASDVAAWRSRGPEVPCTARRGDVLIMRPLLLHASSSATTPGHRRVLHIEYASHDLPGELEWFERCA
jgi:ectoine hydroxylase-related dioxygenase (phytanoyl-CoA dioxygenase family)